MTDQEKIIHRKLMIDFLMYLNGKTNKYVLKGGTSLMLCYGLTRFSEDIDLDGFTGGFFNIINGFIEQYRYKYAGISQRNAKDTDTVKRAIIHYNGDKKLKVEVSYRLKSANGYKVININGISVYTIDSIMIFKLNAYNKRDKIRDLYDITFIYNNYKNQLNAMIINQLRDVIAFDGFSKFDYLVHNQEDNLINIDELTENFLKMYYDLGLN